MNVAAVEPVYQDRAGLDHDTAMRLRDLLTTIIGMGVDYDPARASIRRAARSL